MRRTIAAAVGCVVIATTGGAVALADGGSSPTASAAAKVTVPKLHCRRLDAAEDIVRSKGLRVVERGGGTFGIVVKSNWFVGSQRPAPGTRVARGSKVYLYAAREC
jgi:beta-lactam-binding protein with PASTA domain